MMLHQDEERISINHGLDLIQRKNGLKFGTDALLLSAFIGKHRKDALGIELGSGTGAISLLCLKRNQLQRIIALEVQPLYAALTSRNAALNGLSDRLEAVCTDLRDYPAAEQADVVFTNPPYMTADSGAEAEYEEKHLARHEVRGTIDDFCRCGARMLRYGGSFFAVYRPDRLADLMAAMREARLEPKRMLFVAATPCRAPSMVLVEGKKGANCGLVIPPLFVLQNEDGETSDMMERLTQEGLIHGS